MGSLQPWFVCQYETLEELTKAIYLSMEPLKSELKALKLELEAYICAN